MKKFFLIFLFLSVVIPSQASEKIIISSNNDGYVNIRSAASIQGEIKGIIENGYKERVIENGKKYESWKNYAYYLGEEGNWIKIRTVDGITGYVHKSQVTILNTDDILKADDVDDEAKSEASEKLTAFKAFIVLLILGILLYLFLRHEYRCPNCKKWSMRKVNEVNMGVTSQETRYTSHGSVTRYSRRIKETRRCKYCGYEKIQNYIRHE